jgi:hypothetical protein
MSSIKSSLEKGYKDLEQGIRSIERPRTPPYVRNIRDSIKSHQEELQELRDMSDDEFERHLVEKIPKDFHDHAIALRDVERKKLAKEMFWRRFW